MLETMLALKNNDMRKIPGYDPEPVERLRKLQRTLVSAHVLSERPFTLKYKFKCFFFLHEAHSSVVVSVSNHKGA